MSRAGSSDPDDATSTGAERRPARVAEPDARYLLANQRTYLAWVRTSLGLLAGGVALEVIGLDLHSGLRLAAALVLVVAGIVTPTLAWMEFRRNERALRIGAPLPASSLGPLAGLAVVCAGLLVLLAILV